MRKAEISFTMIVYAVLALFALIVLIFIFKSQMSRGANTTNTIQDDVNNKVDCINEPNKEGCNIFEEKAAEPEQRIQHEWKESFNAYA